MTREFTGRDMAKILVVGFGVVAAVNFFMANRATSGFGGVVVENSYVASQKFNTWLEEAERSKALGWEAKVARDGSGHLVVETRSAPGDATVTAELRRPLGERESATITFARTDDGTYRSVEQVAEGRWTIRLAIESAGDRWAVEEPLL